MVTPRPPARVCAREEEVVVVWCLWCQWWRVGCRVTSDSRLREGGGGGGGGSDEGGDGGGGATSPPARVCAREAVVVGEMVPVVGVVGLGPGGVRRGGWGG